jgi:excisionase family DNA binding protein
VAQRSAAPAETVRLTLEQAARKYKLGQRSLRAAAEAATVPWLERRRWGRGVCFIFDERQFFEWFTALPRCRAERCDEPALADAAFCGRHSRVDRARQADRDLLEAERDWYTRSEAAGAGAAITGAAQQTMLRAIDRAIKAGELPGARVGRHRRVPCAALEAWAARLPVMPVAPEQRPSRASRRRRVSAEERANRRGQVQRLCEEGRKPGEIARLLGWSKPTIVADIDALELERPGRGGASRRLPPEARARRAQEAAERYREGQSLRQIGRAQGSSPTQVRRDLEQLGALIRPRRRPSNYPPPAERACEHCGEPFTPRFPSQGHYRFHSDECARRARTAARDRALAERGLLGTTAAAERLVVCERRVVDYIEAGLLKAERVNYPGALKPTYGIAPPELERFEREWARGEDGRREYWLDPDRVAARGNGAGPMKTRELAHIPDEHACAVVRGIVAERAGRRRQRRKGRKKAAAPSARSQRWSEGFCKTKAERRAEYQQRLELELVEPGEAPPSDWQIAGAVAQADWQDHPEDWPRSAYPPAPHDPDALDRRCEREATDRVWRAIKRLETAPTEITSAQLR